MQRFILSVTFVLLTSVAMLTLAFTHFQQSVEQANKNGQCVDIPATPDYLATNKPGDAIAAINHARIFEHLPALRLPANFYQLQPVQQQFILVNLERTDRGLPALKLDAHLSLVARAYSKQLSDLHFFAHTSPISGAFGDRVNGDPMLVNHYSAAAENLAGNPVAGIGPIYEYLYDDTAEACGHRLNILNPQLTYVGIGMVTDDTYGSMSAQEFIASAPWQPYQPSNTIGVAPQVRIQAQQNSQHKQQLTLKAQVRTTASVERVTWFIDHMTAQPAHIGHSYVLNLAHMSHGRHTIYAYVVDGSQQYAVARYTVQA
jgi:uncharacterized protein YkwD